MASQNELRTTAPQGRSRGVAMHALISELFPICRSITGNGVRRSLAILARDLPITVIEVPSGTPVFDWIVPREWNIRDAYIKDSHGERVVDFNASNLHVLNYSAPLNRRVAQAELRQHLHADPARRTWIPYRTSYYKEDWGFCVTQEQLDSLTEPEYEVVIDSSFSQGALTYGECYLPGSVSDEILISCHICHPSLANDNLSGIALATQLAQYLRERPRRYSYRFLFIPGTIGSITWLALNRENTSRIKHGLVLTCVGDNGPFHYKKSRRGNAEIDRAVAHVLRVRGTPHEVREFVPYGYDERQYCSPGFNLPVGCLMRSAWGEFPEYHSSADDLDFVTPDALADSFEVCASSIDILERNQTYLSTNPYCEPALGRRGLYRSTGGSHIGDENLARLWVLNLADGRHSLLDVAERAGMPFAQVADIAGELARHGLLTERPAHEGTARD